MTLPVDVLRIPTLGGETRAWQYGDASARPLILVHGFRGDHHGLEEIARSIAATLPEVRTIVPDLPGFGETDPIRGREHSIDLYAEWLCSFASEIADDGFAVLGHSFGSLVVSAAIAAGLAPRRAILVNPISSPALEGPQAALTQLSTLYYRAADALPDRPARALLGHPAIVRVMSEVMAKTRDPERRSWIHGQHAAFFSSFASPATLLEAYRASISHTVMQDARSFTMPTLIIAGERDDLTPLAKQLELNRRIPGSQLRIIPGVGHLVHYEAVADTVAWVDAFLTEQLDKHLDDPAATAAEAVA